MFKCNNIFKYNNNITSPSAIIINIRSPYGIVGRRKIVVKHLGQVERRVNKMKTYW